MRSLLVAGITALLMGCNDAKDVVDSADSLPLKAKEHQNRVIAKVASPPYMLGNGNYGFVFYDGDEKKCATGVESEETLLINMYTIDEAYKQGTQVSLRISRLDVGNRCVSITGIIYEAQ